MLSIPPFWLARAMSASRGAIEIGLAAQHLGQALVVDHAGQTVGAHEVHIADA